jgi:hypothetical protein
MSDYVPFLHSVYGKTTYQWNRYTHTGKKLNSKLMTIQRTRLPFQYTLYGSRTQTKTHT